MMDRRQNCHACRLSCPTGAISFDRFLLRAERCIVLHNEKRGDLPFPSWMNSSWHNCIIGCLRSGKVKSVIRFCQAFFRDGEKQSSQTNSRRFCNSWTYNTLSIVSTPTPTLIKESKEIANSLIETKMARALQML